MAARFDGVASRIQLGNTNATNNRSQMSLSFWALTRVFGAGDAYVAYSNGLATGNARIIVEVTAPAGSVSAFRIRCRSLDTDTIRNRQSTGTPLTAAVWQHIVATVDYSVGVGSLYVDGVLNVIGPFDGAFGATSTSATNSLSGGIGAAEDITGSQHINADISDVRLYSSILGPNEVATIFAAMGRDGIVTNLQDRFLLQGGDGQTITAVPSVGIAQTGSTIISGPTYTPDILHYTPRTKLAIGSV